MKRAKTPASRRGRPPKPNASRYTIRLSKLDAETLRELGDDDFTRGVERAAVIVRQAEDPYEMYVDAASKEDPDIAPPLTAAQMKRGRVRRGVGNQ